MWNPALERSTSVDHGTALDLAGTGRADPGSLFEAIRLAGSLRAA
jgi:4-hydroxythreonine-4-phosphate dehydrogenase